MVSFSPRQIVHAQDPWRGERGRKRAAQKAKHGPEADRQTQDTSEARSCSATKRKGDRTEGFPLTERSSRRGRSHLGKLLRNGLASPGRVLAEHTAHLETQPNGTSLTGQISKPPAGAALDAQRGVCAGRTRLVCSR